MKVLLDANVFISYLLPKKNYKKTNKIQTIIESGFAGKYTIVFPQELIEEIRRNVRKKTYLAEHITEEDTEEFITILSSVAELLPLIPEDIPIVTRDMKDDYLLVYATIGECDYLVTGDDDLLVLKQIDNIKIFSPAEFYEIVGRVTK